MSVLCVLHIEGDGPLQRPALEAVATGRAVADALGVSFAIGFAGADPASAAAQVGSAASRLAAVTGADYVESRYCTDAAALEAICRHLAAAIVILPGTSRWLRVAAGVAQRLGGAMDSHVTRVSVDGGAVSVTRWFYRQRMEGTTSRATRPWVIAVEPGTADAWQGAPGTAGVERVPVAAPEIRTRTAGLRAASSGVQTIRPDAELLLVAGAGWTKKQPDGQTHVPEGEQPILGFLDRTKASLGGSKSLVDQSGEGQAVLPFMTHLNQIGQTGSSPRHKKGLATCCHGEEPHVVGWRFVSERRAVNLNPNCGWAQGKADVLYVADAFEVIRKVNERLRP